MSTLRPRQTIEASRRPLIGLEIWLDQAAQLDRKRDAVPVQSLADGKSHPSLADAVFLHRGLLNTIEAHSHTLLEDRSVIVWAFRVVRQTVGRCLGHRMNLQVGGIICS